MLLVAHHKCSSVAILARRLFLHQGFLPLAPVPPSYHHALVTPVLRRLSEMPFRPSTPPACRHQASPAGRRASLGARCASSTHGCHGTRTRVPLEETSRTQVRPAGSARAAHVVQIRPRGSHGVRLRVPLQGIPLIQVRAAGGAGAAPVVRIRLKTSHEGHVRVPLEGIP